MSVNTSSVKNLVNRRNTNVDEKVETTKQDNSKYRLFISFIITSLVKEYMY